MPRNKGYNKVASYSHTEKGKKTALKRAKELREKRGLKAYVSEGTVRGRKVWKVWGSIWKDPKRYDSKSRTYVFPGKKPYWVK